MLHSYRIIDKYAFLKFYSVFLSILKVKRDFPLIMSLMNNI